MHRKNNFDFLRLILASFVIITHSYPISGSEMLEPLNQITDGKINFSYIGVKGFFIISGYLIFQSLERSKNLLDYYWKRMLRLFPGLFIVLLLTILLAPFVYNGDLISYIHNQTAWTYLPRNLSLFNLQYPIDGVFDDNPFKSAINGSLWTIPYEFIMYILLSFLIFFRKNKKVVVVLLLSSFFLLIIGNIFFFKRLSIYGFYSVGSDHLLELGVFFIAGSILSALKIETIKHKNIWLIVSLVILIASLAFNFFDYTKFYTFPVIIILIGISSTPYINRIGDKIGDLSYGVYIYAFPVQQTLEHYFKLGYLSLMFYTLIVCLPLAYLSWHLVEKRALKLKKLKFTKKIPQPLDVNTSSS